MSYFTIILETAVGMLDVNTQRMQFSVIPEKDWACSQYVCMCVCMYE